MYYKEIEEKEFLKALEYYRILHMLKILKTNITTDEDKNGHYIELRMGNDVTPRIIIQVKDLKIKYYERSDEE